LSVFIAVWTVEEESCCLLSVFIAVWTVEEEACCLLSVFIAVWRRKPVVSGRN